MAIQRLTDKTALGTTPASDDLLMIIDVSDTTGSPEGTSKKITVANLGTGGGGSGTVTSVALTAPAAFSVAGSPITTSGTLALSMGGLTTQYLDGSGALQTFPNIPSVPVDSVNGQTGVVVLDTDDIAEGTTNEYFTDARVAANSAVTANTAKVGITPTQASDITTNNAKVSNVQSDWNASSGLAVILNKPTLTSGTVTSITAGTGLSGGTITATGTIAIANTAVTAGAYTSANITVDAQGRITAAASGSSGGVTSVTGTAPIVSSGGGTPAISISAATTTSAGSMSGSDKLKLNLITTNYEEDELNTGQNILMNTSVSTASNKIVDIMADALADTSNANSKKLIGFHTGSGVCVLQGMVDAGNSISGASEGGALWIGASGAFSSAAPTTTNYYSRVVGYYVGNGQGGEVICYFDPSKDWVQIS